VMFVKMIPVYNHSKQGIISRNVCRSLAMLFPWKPNEEVTVRPEDGSSASVGIRVSAFCDRHRQGLREVRWSPGQSQISGPHLTPKAI
jgi:hypothetical protein